MHMNKKGNQVNRENLLKLENAIKAHQVQEVDNLLKKSPGSLQLYNRNLFSLLDLAIEEADLQIMDLLMEKGFNINNMDREHAMSAVQFAVHLGNLEVFNKVLSYNPDLSLKNKDQKTVLHFATEGSGIEKLNILQVLLSKGLDIDDANKDGVTPLMNAMRVGDLGMVKMLVENGASLSIPKSANSIVDLAIEGSNIQGYLREVITAIREQKELEGQLQEFQALAPPGISSKEVGAEVVSRKKKSL